MQPARDFSKLPHSSADLVGQTRGESALRGGEGLSPIPSLRGAELAKAVGGAIRAGTKHFGETRPGFRVVHFSIQATHIHLIVEAGSKLTLGRGVRGLSIRVARAVNRTLGRNGRVFADRYHARPMRAPRDVRNTIVYVLANWRHHIDRSWGVDDRSSARWFDGWAEAIPDSGLPSPVARARTWLLATGWRRHGLIGLHEAPADCPP